VKLEETIKGFQMILSVSSTICRSKLSTWSATLMKLTLPESSKAKG